MAAPLQTTDKHTNNPSGTIAPSEVCKLDIPEFEAHLHASPCSQKSGITKPFDEKTDAVTALLRFKEDAILFPIAPTIQEHDVSAHSSEGQRLSLATESEGASILPENEVKDQDVDHSNEHAAIACSVYPITEPTREIMNEKEPCRGQGMSTEDVTSNPQSHTADSIEVSNHWDNDAWMLGHKTTLIETTQENFPSKHQALPCDQLDNQAIDELFSQAGWPEISQIEYSPSFGPKGQLAEHENWIDVPDFATDFLKETRNSSPIPDHHSPPHDMLQEATLDVTEMGISKATAPATTDPQNIEEVITEDMSHSSDETAGIKMDQHPRAGSQARARSTSPIIIDTNNGEPIVIEDSSDSSDVSAFSNLSDITSDPRIRAGSQRRVRSRPLRVLEGMVRWSDENLAMGNRTVIQRLWTDAQNYWKSMRELKCLAKSKSVKKFDKMMTKAKERTQQGGGTISMEDAGKLTYIPHN